jgi:hypothetical protein
MVWVLIGVGAWIALAIVVALLIGRSIGLADRQSIGTRRNFVVDDMPPYFPLPSQTPPPAERPTEPSLMTADAATEDDEPEDPSTVPGIPSARPAFLPPVPPSSARPKNVRRQSEAG